MSRKFPLAGLLRLRELRESTAAGALYSANNRLARGNRRMESLTRRASEADEPVFDADTLLSVAAARASSRSMLTEQLAYLSQLQKDADLAGAHYAQARQELAAVRKLAQRHREATAEAELAADQQMIDEAASRSHGGDGS